MQVILEAIPWLEEFPSDDQQAAHRRRRSFAAMSGRLPVRIVVILAADISGACPNLKHDLRCGIYERRPLVCRIYPAEINPFILTKDGKVYALGAMGDLFCLDVKKGGILWQKNFVKDYDAPVATWGWAASPLLDGDQLICLVGAKNAPAAVAVPEVNRLIPC